MVNYLLDSRADPNIGDVNNHTPLAEANRQAARVGSDKIYDRLIAGGALRPVHPPSNFAPFFLVWEAIMVILFGLFVHYGPTVGGGGTPSEGRWRVLSWNKLCVRSYSA